MLTGYDFLRSVIDAFVSTGTICVSISECWAGEVVSVVVSSGVGCGDLPRPAETRGPLADLQYPKYSGQWSLGSRLAPA